MFISARSQSMQGKFIQVTVADTGIGISMEDQEKVFEKFFRSKDQLASGVAGTGLGLNISRHLVQLQGGKIWFESQLRKGTSFHFTIPISPEKES